MRTTLTIDDDVFGIAKSLAASEGVSLGKALSELARKGINKPPDFTYRNGLPVFRVREDSPIITSEQVKRIEEDSW
jgi:hypothetical protein